MLDTILQQVLSCQQCNAQLTPNPVLQVGEKAKILIAGQAPGRLADLNQKPFSDPSGNRLKHWLGLNDAEFYDKNKVAILPMAFCYPGKAKSGDKAPPKICAQLWREKLLAKMPDIRLTLVLGNYARAYHLGGGQNKLTQVVYENRFLTRNIVCLPHPSPRNQAWFKQNPWFEADLLPRLKIKVAQSLVN